MNIISKLSKCFGRQLIIWSGLLMFVFGFVFKLLNKVSAGSSVKSQNTHPPHCRSVFAIWLHGICNESFMTLASWWGLYFISQVKKFTNQLGQSNMEIKTYETGNAHKKVKFVTVKNRMLALSAYFNVACFIITICELWLWWLFGSF